MADKTTINRRHFLAAPVALAGCSALAGGPSTASPKASAFGAARVAGKARWVSTRKDDVWRDLSGQLSISETAGGVVRVAKDQPAQIIDGFGACFNELGWDALSLLSPEDREDVLSDFFGRGASRSMGFTHCRMPLAANDFARDWYSFNKTPGDFEMANFSIARDETSLVPYINAAKAHQPDLHVWASPWSPPVWMKTNGHYAQNMGANNGLTEDQMVMEGEDGFIQEKAYFKAYALYFKKFIEAYRDHDIAIEMVMPQNEFNSNQTFPSCCWTPEGLARFIPYLHDAMGPLGVDIFFGTLERPNTDLFKKAYEVPKVRKAIKGIGFQWAGRGAVPFLNYSYPDLKLYQTEQECGDGRNDWRFARYTWDLMKDYMRGGVSVYEYWNMALVDGEASTWGWNQNSLIIVDRKTGRYRFSPDYYVFKHVAHFVKPGAQRVNAQSWTGHDNALAFINTDGSEVIVYQNDLPEPLPLSVNIAGKSVEAVLPPNSLNTISV